MKKIAGISPRLRERRLGRLFRVCWPLIVAAPAGVNAQEQLLIQVGDLWSYVKGTESAPPDWTAIDFDDSDWEMGPTGIGYGDNDDSTVLGDMENGYLSILTRKTFSVANLGAISTLTLRIVYDDGFIAYLNGAEIGRANMPAGDVTESTPALVATEPGAPLLMAADPSLLKIGKNVLAVRVHNAALTSSDLSFIPELVVNADLCPNSLTCSYTIANGSKLSWTNFARYDSITVRRNGQVLGQDLDGDLQSYQDPDPPSGEVTYEVVAVEGKKSCTPVSCTVIVIHPEDILIDSDEEWSYRKGTAPPPDGWNLVSFDDSSWAKGQTGIGYGDGDDATVLDDMQFRADDPATPENESRPGYAAIFVRKSFQISSLDGVETLIFSVIYDDGFVAYLNGEEIGRANMPQGDVTEDTFALVAIEPGAPLQIKVPASFAKTGRNVLAASVHNANLTSSDLSFIPIFARLGKAPARARFRRGDADDSGPANITDAVFILRGLFQGGEPPPCPDAADVDDSGVVNITDAVFLLRFLFQGGAQPPAPGTTCGEDPTADNLGPCVASGC